MSSILQQDKHEIVATSFGTSHQLLPSTFDKHHDVEQKKTQTSSEDEKDNKRSGTEKLHKLLYPTMRKKR